MSRFDAAWLSLRAPADARARAADLPLLLRHHVRGRDRLNVLDLGCGTGANLRALVPSLPACQDWLCLDADEDLLGYLPDAVAAWAVTRGYGWDPQTRVLRHATPPLSCRVRARSFDLAIALDKLTIEAGTLVTASALIDLVSEAWLAGLVERCAAARAPLLIALTYDGRVELEPALALDRELVEILNGHQHRDKGFGPALGPDAAARLAVLAAARGYWVQMRRSDWRIKRSERALQAALINGWSEAACEQAPDRTGAIRHWQQVRLAAVAQGCSRIQVGHRDLLALPGGR